MANENNDIALAVSKQQLELSALIDSKLVYALKNIQLDRIKLEVEMHKKLYDIEKEYHQKLVEFDAKRAAIVNGEKKPTEEECEYPFRDPDVKPVDPPADQKGIPNFWATILHNLEMFNDMVQLCDEPILEKLSDIRCVLLSNPDGYKLEFEFDENEYFTDKVLTKEYYFAESFDPNMPLEYDGPYVSFTRGCTINWKPGKDVTKETYTKKMKNKGNNQVKSVSKERPCDSFFNFFAPPTERIEDFEDAELDSDREQIHQLLISDFDIAETLRHNVIPRAVIYYTGEGIEDEEDYDYDEDDDEFDDDLDEDMDEDESDEDDEADDGDKHKTSSGKQAGGVNKKKGNRHLKGSKGEKDVPPECKQQ